MPSTSEQENTATSNIFIIIGGIVIVSIHIVIGITTRYMLPFLICLYAIGFAILALTFTRKKKTCMTSIESEMALYGSIFVIIVNVIAIFMIIVKMMRDGSNNYYGNNYYSSYSR